MNRLNRIDARAAFVVRSLCSICLLAVLLIAFVLSTACGTTHVVSETPLVITGPGQCQAEETKDNLKRHRTRVAEGFILYIPPEYGEVVRERNTKNGATRVRRSGAYSEDYKVVTQSGEDTGVYFSPTLRVGSDLAKIGEVLKKNSSADDKNLSPVRLRIIASMTPSCGLGTLDVLKIEEADTGKVLYENKSASRDK